MELSEEGIAPPSNVEKLSDIDDGLMSCDQVASESDRDTARSKNVNVKRSKNSDQVSRSTVGHVSLDKNQLLTLFDGSVENVEYYCQIRELMSRLSVEEQRQVVCDPRDAKKVVDVGHWRPASIVSDIQEVIKQWEAHDVNFVSKQTAVDENVDEIGNDEGEPCGKGAKSEDGDKSFPCGVHGCGEICTSLALYEAHYHRCHNYVCATCRRSFVSSFLLDIHIQENHDSYFQILSSRIDMYHCLVEKCDLKFRTADIRKDHMVTVHKFPANFSFHRPLKNVKLTPSPLDCVESHMEVAIGSCENDSTAMETVEMSSRGQKGKRGKSKKDSNQRVPTTICFGRGSQRGFQRRGHGNRGRHWHQSGRPDTDTTVDIESVDMEDLAEALQG